MKAGNSCAWSLKSPISMPKKITAKMQKPALLFLHSFFSSPKEISK